MCVSFSSPSLSNLLCKFDDFCESRELTNAQIDKEAKRFFNWAIAKGYDHCVFPEYLAGFAKGKWCPFTGWDK